MHDYRVYIENIKKGNTYFCRAMNMYTRDNSWLCKDCPLYSGNEDDIIAGQTRCRYVDNKDEFPDYWDDSQDSHGVYAEVPQKAVKFAAHAHKGATRKGNGLPYIVHPIETMGIVAHMTDDGEVLAAAALHDVIEDTHFKGRDIEERFGERVAGLVGMETEDKKRHRPAADTWRERKEENLRRERCAPIEAKQIMLADKLSNVRSTLRDFRRDREGIWDNFNMKDPAEQEWYYRAVADVLSELSGEEVYREYVKILDKIFE